MKNNLFVLFAVLLAAFLLPCNAEALRGAQGANPSPNAPVLAPSAADWKAEGVLDGGCRYESGTFCADPSKRYIVYGAFDVSGTAGGAAEILLLLESPSGEEELAVFDVSEGGAFPVEEALPKNFGGEFSLSLCGEGILNADLSVREIAVEVVGDCGGASGKPENSGLLGYVSWFNYSNSMLGNYGYAPKSGVASPSGLKGPLNVLGSALGVLYVDAANGSDLAAGTKDAPKATISAALAAAQSGQTIILESGTHAWDGSVSGKSVTIRPNGSVTIRGAR